MIRQEAVPKIQLGRTPSTIGNEVDPGTVENYQTLIEAIELPVTDQEAVELVNILGPDDFFGLSWSLIHIIETSPGWPIASVLPDKDERDGVKALRIRGGS